MLKIQLTTHFAETLSSREDDLQSILEAKSSSRWSGSDNYRMGIYMGPLELYNFGGGGSGMRDRYFARILVGLSSTF